MCQSFELFATIDKVLHFVRSTFIFSSTYVFIFTSFLIMSKSICLGVPFGLCIWILPSIFFNRLLCLNVYPFQPCFLIHIYLFIYFEQYVRSIITQDSQRKISIESRIYPPKATFCSIKKKILIDIKNIDFEIVENQKLPHCI